MKEHQSNLRINYPPTVQEIIDRRGMPPIHAELDDLLAFAQGELSGDLLDQVEAHLETCSGCRDYVENFRMLLAAQAGADKGTDRDSELPLLKGDNKPLHYTESLRGNVVAKSLGRSRNISFWTKSVMGLAASLAVAFTVIWLVKHGVIDVHHNNTTAHDAPRQAPPVPTPRGGNHPNGSALEAKLPDVVSGIAVRPAFTAAGFQPAGQVLSPIGEVIPGEPEIVVQNVARRPTDIRMAVVPDEDVPHMHGDQQRTYFASRGLDRMSFLMQGTRLTINLRSPLPAGNYRYSLWLLDTSGQAERIPGQYRFTKAGGDWDDLEWARALARFGKWKDAESRLVSLRARRSLKGDRVGVDLADAMLASVRRKSQGGGRP